MDPNAALKEIRREIAKLDTLDRNDLEDVNANLKRLVESTQALDNWLSNGGFLPIAWQGSVLQAVKGVTRS